MGSNSDYKHERNMQIIQITTGIECIIETPRMTVLYALSRTINDRFMPLKIVVRIHYRTV
jgi:hypothetical protein